MRTIARWIAEALDKRSDEAALARIRGQVRELADSFPLYDWLREPQLAAARASVWRSHITRVEARHRIDRQCAACRIRHAAAATASSRSETLKRDQWMIGGISHPAGDKPIQARCSTQGRQ